MKNIFATTAAIEEINESPSNHNKSFWKYSANLLLLVIIGSFLSSMIASFASSFFFSQSAIANEILQNATTDYDAIYNAVYEALMEWTIQHPNIYMSLQLFGTAGTIAVVLFFTSKIDHRRIVTLGIFKKGAVPEYIVGLIIGIIMFAAVYGIMLLSGQAEFAGISPRLHIGALIAFFFAYLIQGMSEELLIRGYYMTGVANCTSVHFAVFASSVAFSLLHFGNNGISVLAFINIFLFGVFTAFYFLRRGSIWGVAAIHSSWNYVQGQIFGCSVSGNFGATSLFETTYKEGSTLFNGGEFGPEGGLAITIVLVIGIIILLPMKNKRMDVPLPRYSGEFHSAV